MPKNGFFSKTPSPNLLKYDKKYPLGSITMSKKNGQTHPSKKNSGWQNWDFWICSQAPLGEIDLCLPKGLPRKEQRPPSTVLLPLRWQTPLVSSSRGSRRKRLKLLLQIRFSLNLSLIDFTAILMCSDFGEENGGSEQVLGWAAWEKKEPRRGWSATTTAEGKASCWGYCWAASNSRFRTD